MKIDTNSLVSATDLNRNSGQLLARASNGERLVVLNQNRPFAAIVSIKDLNRLENPPPPAAHCHISQETTRGFNSGEAKAWSMREPLYGRHRKAEPTVFSFFVNMKLENSFQPSG